MQLEAPTIVAQVGLTTESLALEAMVRGQHLRTALQPVKDLSTGVCVGVEALTRVTCKPQLGPDQWLKLAEEAGCRTELELAMLHCALLRLKALPDGWLAINASPLTIMDERFVEILEHRPLSRIVIEVSEQSPIEDYDVFLHFLAPLRDAGARLAVDDFGAGNASLAHLIRLEPDFIKLDRAIVQRLGRSATTRALAAALTGFAMETGMAVVAEGIETDEMCTMARVLGASLGQGYLLGRPE